MIKKIIMILICLVIIILFGCNAIDSGIVASNDSAISASYNPSFNTFEIDALKFEEEYLQSKSDEDLKKLCNQLRILPWNKKQLREMVLNYYPVFFKKFSEDQIKDISENGFDPFYEEYVFTYKAEGRGGLEAIYKEYKGKANNKYSYARSVYENVSELDNLTDGEYAFLYDEAYNLYAEARGIAELCTTESENSEAYINVLCAFGCIDEICEAMGKEVEPDIIKDFQEYVEGYMKSI